LFAVVWVNRGSAADDSDNFAAVYGANQDVARQIVDQAISDWSAVIRDFDYDRDNDPTTNNTFRLILIADNVVSGDFGETFFDLINVFGKPTSAVVYMGLGGTDGWFFDPSPANHNEFTHIVNPFQASSTQPGNDFYRSILHQIGHAVGIAIEPGLALTNHLTFFGDDQVDPAPLFVFRNLSGQFGVSVTMTEYDGGNIYEGPVDPAFNRFTPTT
jgi:hypothetical protein